MQLRDYQLELIDNTRAAFRTRHSRVLAVLPCGAGKTVCFADMCKRHAALSPNNVVWFLVHRRELIDQTVATFRTFNISMHNVVIGMVQTVARNIEKYAPPTLIIFDEAHHTTANTWRSIISKFPETPIIGLTATPCRLSGEPLGSIFDALVVGVSARWLIEHKWLSDYDYYAPATNIRDGEYKPRGADYDMSDVVEQFERAKIYDDVIKYIDFGRKAILYAPSVAFSERMVNYINSRYRAAAGLKTGDIAVHFDGNTPERAREQIIADFRAGKIRILANVDLIGEGFDVPDCDSVLLLRPTKSTALYIQQATRCLRPNGSKRAAIYDFVGNVFRHGMPTEDREWSLDTPVKMRNKTNAPDLLVRECGGCFRVYAGAAKLCPYCGNDNGKTRSEIQRDEKIQLELITAVERKRERIEVGMSRDYGALVELARKRGYKNPSYWARQIMNGRHSKLTKI